MQVVAVALEYLVLLDVNLDIQIAGRAAVHARLAVAGRADPHAVVDAGRNLHFQRLVALDAAGAGTGRARLRNDLAGAVAFRAGLLDAEKALLHPHLAVAAAGGASDRRSAGLGAGTVTGIALVPRRYPDRGVEAVRRLLQRDLEVVAQIGAAIDLRTAATAAARTAATEDVAED